ncbi:MAG: DUF802 domain-containing protein [Gammaproteobacteria bacterium]|nr:DUF802 domain-containing protein [Gammaproteobacteria bacterium]
MMTRIIFIIAFILGAAAIAAMGANFIESNILALTVTVVIAAVYSIGFIELYQYRRATSTLTNALDSLSQNDTEQLTVLDEWLIKLHPSLHNAVRQRIENGHVGLPTPVLTPYLIGLLIMLGLLGTFVGLVETLKGVVVVLEGSPELDAMRQALTAPMGGLGLAFGTSVAGVAASAMLGLMSTLSKRDRMLSCRQLDNKIALEFHCFSQVYKQQEILKAVASQTQDLPDVAGKLHTLINHMEQMSDQMGEQLLTNQTSFHASTQTMLSDLTASIEKSLHEGVIKNNQVVADSGHLIIEGIKPVLQDAMSEISNNISRNVDSTHQQLNKTVEAQLQTLSGHFRQTSEDVTQAWKKGLAAHEHSNETLTQGMSHSFSSFNEAFSSTTSDVIASLNTTISTWKVQQETSNKEQLESWTNALQETQNNSASQLLNTSDEIIHQFTETADKQQSSFKVMTEATSTLLTRLSEQVLQSGQEALSQQQQITTVHQDSSTQTLSDINRLLSTSEALIQTRIDTEATWLEGHEERMTQLAGTLKTELSSLRDDEVIRGQAAIERLTVLESSVATHLASLGKALEDPMSHLIELASETPRAAAEVIGQLRQEISNNIEKDNNLLDERRILIEKLDTASTSFSQSSTEQLASIEQLVNSSAGVLQGISEQFNSNVTNEISKVSEVANNFAVSAVEISSLGEAFSLAVNLFNDSNNKLMGSLNQIETSLEQSTTRSDEQLAYYVAQAREVIDYSVLNQKEIFDEIRKLDFKNARTNEPALASAEVS